jgi:chemotaxis protein CheX
MPNAVELTDSLPIDTHEWEQLLSKGAQEVFEMMIGIPLESCADTSPHAFGEFTAVIGLAGPINGVFAIRCDEKTACGIACGMLGVDENEAKAQVWDALGEVCNMVVGNFKGKTGKPGESSVLSVPTVIHGHDYRVRPLTNGFVVQCRMQTSDGTVHLRLDYKLAL